jgi:hypothetical protein
MTFFEMNEFMFFERKKGMAEWHSRAIVSECPCTRDGRTEVVHPTCCDMIAIKANPGSVSYKKIRKLRQWLGARLAAVK